MNRKDIELVREAIKIDLSGSDTEVILTTKQVQKLMDEARRTADFTYRTMSFDSLLVAMASEFMGKLMQGNTPKASMSMVFNMAQQWIKDNQS